MSDLIDTSKQDKFSKRDKLRLDRENNDIKKIVSIAEGRRFYWRLLGLCRTFKNSYTGNSTTFYNEGIRSVGLALLEMLMNAKPEAFAQMQQEFHSEQKSQEALDKIEEEKEKKS